MHSNEWLIGDQSARKATITAQPNWEQTARKAAITAQPRWEQWGAGCHCGSAELRAVRCSNPGLGSNAHASAEYRGLHNGCLSGKRVWLGLPGHMVTVIKLHQGPFPPPGMGEEQGGSQQGGSKGSRRRERESRLLRTQDGGISHAEKCGSTCIIMKGLINLRPPSLSPWALFNLGKAVRENDPSQSTEIYAHWHCSWK